MKKTEKLKIIDELLEKKSPEFLCNQLQDALSSGGFLGPYPKSVPYENIIACIPEFARIKPDRKNTYRAWFGCQTIKNLPRRMKALRQLRDIILSS